MATTTSSYRPNVAAILQREDGRIFVAERVDYRGSWQFPQGGVDKGEDLIAALFREVSEEIGVPPEAYRIVACRTGYRYKFPGGHLKKGLFCGQEQTYFLCRYLGNGDEIDLARHTREFSDYKWIKPEKFKLKWVPKFKRRVFRNVMKDFFNLAPK
ncbi:MAG: RNA pyrophosphohydrolase [Verrucomicrobiales bacterium]|nr:RNA pyrophosphohydrolase [Verrucomicrobiales bacterium]